MSGLFPSKLKITFINKKLLKSTALKTTVVLSMYKNKMKYVISNNVLGDKMLITYF